MTNKQQLGGALLFIAAFIGLLFNPIMEALNSPGYNISIDTISSLGALQPTILLFGVTLVVSGVLGLTGTLLAYNALGKWFTALLVISCMGEIGVGLFPSLIPWTYAYACHVTSAMTIVVLGVIVMLRFYKRFNEPFSSLSFGLGILALIGGLLIPIVVVFPSLIFGLGMGIMERIMYYPLMVWQVGLGGALMELHPKLSLRRAEK
jgi:hypothetical protein